MSRGLLTLIVLLAAPVAQAEVRLRASVNSDYIYRGVLQTSAGEAYQGLAEYVSDRGFYGGVWVSRVNYPFDDRKLEIDYFAGYQRRISKILALDFTVVRNTYDKESIFGDYDWTELQLTAHLWDQWSVLFGAGENWLGREARSYVGEITYRHALPVRIVADITVGRQYAKRAFFDHFNWAELGLSRKLGPLEARVAYSTTSGSEYFGSYLASRWYVSLSWQTNFQ